MSSMFKLATKFEAEFKRNPEFNEMKDSLQSIVNEWNDETMSIKLRHEDSSIGVDVKKNDIVSGNVGFIVNKDVIHCRADFIMRTDIGSKALKEINANTKCWRLDVLSTEKAGFVAIDGEWGKRISIVVEIKPEK